jgi:hypothetical protein
MKNVYFTILIGVVLLLSCCKKNNNNQNTFTNSSYPLAVGNWWQYQVVDFLGGTTDTVMLSAVSVVSDGSTKDYKCNLIKNGMIIDSGHFIVSDTALAYHGSHPSYSIFGYFNFKFPFTSGQKWSGTMPADTFIVAGVDKSLKILGNTYSPDYSLTRRVFVPEYSLIQIMDLTPGVGLIDQSIDIQSDTAAWEQEGIQLISYHLQ